MDLIPALASPQLYAVLGRDVYPRLLTLAAHLAVRGPLLLLDCGNRGNPLPIVKELRRLSANPVATLSQLHSARAFTCHQVVALLQETAAHPAYPTLLILDLLSTFFDESVSYSEGRRLLEQSMKCILQLSKRSIVLVSLKQPPAEFPERKSFVELVTGEADVLWAEEAAAVPTALQLPLFP
jgi:hypothetical protein